VGGFEVFLGSVFSLNSHSFTHWHYVAALMRLPAAALRSQRQIASVGDEVDLRRENLPRLRLKTWPSAWLSTSCVLGCFPHARYDSVRPDVSAIYAPEVPVELSRGVEITPKSLEAAIS